MNVHVFDVAMLLLVTSFLFEKMSNQLNLLYQFHAHSTRVQSVECQNCHERYIFGML